MWLLIACLEFQNNLKKKEERRKEEKKKRRKEEKKKEEGWKKIGRTLRDCELVNMLFRVIIMKVQSRASWWSHVTWDNEIKVYKGMFN